MNSARPRHSVLALFDPLLAVNDPSTPPRNLSSPDSDKENVTITSFFNRTYSSSHPQPPQLKHRLIDVGDATLDDFSINASLIEEDGPEADLIHDSDDDENDTLTFRHMAEAATPKWHSRPTSSTPNTLSPSAPRTPLADLPLERDATPLARSKVYRRPVVPHPSNLSQVQPITAQELSPESVVLQVTNVSSPITPSSSESLIPPIYVTHNELGHSSAELLSSSVCTLNLATPTGTLLTDASLPTLISPSSPPSSNSDIQDDPPVPAFLDQSRLRPNPSSSVNPNRCSVDLQASFQLQLESEDATFDLLNDKISFLGSKNGMDSFFNALEGGVSFDMSAEEEKMDSILKSIKAEETDRPPPKMKPADDELVVREPTSQEQRCFGSLKSAKHVGLSKALPTARSPDQQDQEKPSPIVAPTKSLKIPLLSTPSSKRDLPRVPPPAVPALKIVKRAKVWGHLKSDSTSSTGSSEDPPVACTVIDHGSTGAIPRAPPTSRLPPSREVSSNLPSTSRDIAVRVPARKTKAATPVASIPGATLPVVNGARRVLISDGPSMPTQPKLRNRTVTASVQSSEGSCRLQQPPPVSNIPTKPLTVSGLKRPLKYGSSIGTISSLPKPVSRNGASRLPTIGVHNGGSSVPARRIV